MNVFDIFRRKRIDPQRPAAGVQLRPNDGLGVWTKYLGSFIPRKVEAEFYEYMREAIPVVDAAIGRLISLDGVITVSGKNDALVKEIREWMSNVRVNDLQRGIQAFHTSIANEAFEQGFGLGEFIVSPKRDDIIGLRVADSKFIRFKREKAGEGVKLFQLADGDLAYTELRPETLIYFGLDNENQNPYGTPLFRSCEFVSQILVTIQNATRNVWERFGDPSFSIVYKTSRRDGADHEARVKQMYAEFDTAIRAKREGKSADFIRAIDRDSEIDIKVIGADGQILELEVPARHVLEQIVAKSRLPPWMLGLHWSTTERLSNSEAEMLLADVATRQAALTPAFTDLVKTLLRLRGRTWKDGDWWIEWENVNLHDVVAQAQARFLNAQADYYYMTTGAEAGIVVEREDLSIGQRGKEPRACGCDHHGAKVESTRPIAWPAMDAVEHQFYGQLEKDWNDLRDRVMGVLGLKPLKSGKADLTRDLFTYTEQQRASILDALKTMIGIYRPGDPNSPLIWYYGEAFSNGVFQAANMLGSERPILDILRNEETLKDLVANGFSLVKDNATKAITGQILGAMEAHVLAGSSPLVVAGALERMFGAQNANWERLVRTEMAMASERAKVAEWSARGIDTRNAIIAGQDTHPNCRCANSVEERNGKWVIVFIPAPDACSICEALAT